MLVQAFISIVPTYIVLSAKDAMVWFFFRDFVYVEAAATRKKNNWHSTKMLSCGFQKRCWLYFQHLEYFSQCLLYM